MLEKTWTLRCVMLVVCVQKAGTHTHTHAHKHARMLVAKEKSTELSCFFVIGKAEGLEE